MVQKNFFIEGMDSEEVVNVFLRRDHKYDVIYIKSVIHLGGNVGRLYEIEGVRVEISSDPSSKPIKIVSRVQSSERVLSVLEEIFGKRPADSSKYRSAKHEHN